LCDALLPLIEVIEQLTTRIEAFDRTVEKLAEDRYPDTGATADAGARLRCRPYPTR
jgi:hypothetical protein